MQLTGCAEMSVMGLAQAISPSQAMIYCQYCQPVTYHQPVTWQLKLQLPSCLLMSFCFFKSHCAMLQTLLAFQAR